MIAEVKAKFPDVIFLSEAFTRPKMMQELAKAGFTQSYTYFTWRNSKSELRDLTELDPDRFEGIFSRKFFYKYTGYSSGIFAKRRPPGISYPKCAGSDGIPSIRHL